MDRIDENCSQLPIRLRAPSWEERSKLAEVQRRLSRCGDAKSPLRLQSDLNNRFKFMVTFSAKHGGQSRPDSESRSEIPESLDTSRVLTSKFSRGERLAFGNQTAIAVVEADASSVVVVRMKPRRIAEARWP